MFQKCLVCGVLACVFVMNVVAMLGCDYKALNRKVDAYTIAVEENQCISEEVFQRDLQFLSAEAIADKSFQDFVDIRKFDELYARKTELPRIGWFADLCKNVFTASSSELKKAQAFILLKHVIMILEILKSTDVQFVPTVFD